MTGKTALVLSGGGAKGAFECGAEKYAREVKGYHWDIIAGVSAGALNGAMLALEKYDRLLEIWNTISNDQVYTGGFNIWSAIKLLFGAKSFYGNGPLVRMIEQEFNSGVFFTDLRVGSVSLVTGEYVQFTPDMANFDRAVLASTVMPIIWEPDWDLNRLSDLLIVIIDPLIVRSLKIGWENKQAVSPNTFSMLGKVNRIGRIDCRCLNHKAGPAIDMF